MRPAEPRGFCWPSRHILWFTGVPTSAAVRLQRQPPRPDSAGQIKRMGRPLRMATVPKATSISIHGSSTQELGTLAASAASLLTSEMLARFESRAATYDRENRFFDQDFEEFRAT